jgi:hypothetical protein
MQRADHSDENTENDADHQRADRDRKGYSDTVEIALPPVRFYKSLMELCSQI